MKPVEINPNDEWINVSKDLAWNIMNSLLLLLHLIMVKSDNAFIIWSNIANFLFFWLLFSFYLQCIFFFFFADGNGWNISTDMYPL